MLMTKQHLTPCNYSNRQQCHSLQKHYASSAAKVPEWSTTASYTNMAYTNRLKQVALSLCMITYCPQPTLKPVLIRQIPKVWQAWLI